MRTVSAEQLLELLAGRPLPELQVPVESDERST